MVFNNFNKKFIVTQHTDHVGPGSIFFALPGETHNGIDFVCLAIDRGAGTIFVDACVTPENNKYIYDYAARHNVTIIQSKNLYDDFIAYCQTVYGNAHKKIPIIGVTGTKGKTSTTMLIACIMEYEKKNIAILSTRYNRIKDTYYRAPLTTPKADYIYAFIDECVRQNIDCIIIEVAAQAVSMRRIEGLEFDVIVFTNFGHEHGEFYPTQDDYFLAKKKLFMQLKSQGKAILNGDDLRVYSLVFDDILKNKHIILYGQKESNNIIFKPIECTFKKSQFRLFSHNSTYDVSTILYGEHMMYNIVAAHCATKNFLLKEGVCIASDLKNMRDIFFDVELLKKGFDGVGNIYEFQNNKYVYIDKAHTPESFETILQNLKKHNLKLIVVFGCGGERDIHKRPMIAGVCEKYADQIVVTEDNPRNESLEKIISDIMLGFREPSRVRVILDRKEAIKFCMDMYNSDCIIALLGKGGEQYQLRGNTKIYCNEKEIVLACHE